MKSKLIFLCIVFVCSCNLVYGQNSEIRKLTFKKTKINGIEQSVTNPEFFVQAGASIEGEFAVLFEHNKPESHVLPLACTPTWGEKKNDYWLAVSDMVNGKIYKGKISLNAPSKTGIYYIILANMSEFTATQIVSATNWHIQQPSWDDGNDLFDLSNHEINEGIQNGYISHSQLTSKGYNIAKCGLTAIKLNIVNIPEDEISGGLIVDEIKFSSILILGPSEVRGGEVIKYECFGKKYIGSTPILLNNVSWQLVDFDPVVNQDEDLIKFENNQLIITEEIQFGFKFKLRAEYGAIMAEKVIQVIPDPPKLIETSKAYVWTIPQNIPTAQVGKNLAESLLSDAAFKLILENIVKISFSHGMSFILGFLMESKFVGSGTELDIFGIQDNKRIEFVNVGIDDEVYYELRYQIGDTFDFYSPYYKGIDVEIDKIFENAGDDFLESPYSQSTQRKIDSYQILSSFDVKKIHSSGYNLFTIYPKIPLTFGKPGQYQIKVKNSNQSDRAFYVFVK